MNNYIEYNNKIAFHPGYYISELIEESGLSQEDFAKRLGTAPKNLSILVNAKQNLSLDICTKLSRMLGTTITYWLNLQQTYDEICAEFLSDKELKKEREIFHFIDYAYFRDHFDLPAFPRKTDAQIRSLREFLSVSSLNILCEVDFATSFRSYSNYLSQLNIVNANAMVQLAINQALKTETPKFNKKKFNQAVEFSLTQTENHSDFYPVVKKAFAEAGVILVALPNLKGSGINGATKRIDGRILLMVNDRRHYADTFWFTMFHEIGHIMNGDYGMTFKENKNTAEDEADLYASNMLIPSDAYENFLKRTDIPSEYAIRTFAKTIKRDPGIVFGRLQKDGKIPYNQSALGNRIRHKYTIRCH